MSYEEVIKILEEHDLLLDHSSCSLFFSYLSYNSKDVNQDTLFICKGVLFKDDYLDEAIENGATCYISEKDYNKSIDHIIVSDVRRAMALISHKFYKVDDAKCKLIGVTGTSGKSTTVNFVKDILNRATKNKNIYISTPESYIGGKSIKFHNTTPEVIDIDRCIKNTMIKDIDYMVLEVSSQASKLSRIYGMSFDIGVFTNISLDHISLIEHKDFNEYLNCKLNFLRKCKKIVINKDTDYYEEIIRNLKDKEIVTVGYHNADYIIKDITRGRFTSFVLSHNNSSVRYEISMKGDFNVLNAALAIAVAKELNIKDEFIRDGIRNTSVLGRMNIFNNFRCPVIVDYAHNKYSLEALIKMIHDEYKNKNIKLVFGCTGDRGLNRIDDLSLIAAKNASYVYLTSDDPGDREVLDICFLLSNNLKKYGTSYEIVIDRVDAIDKALENATKDDVILIIGKGDETYQRVKQQVIDYEGDINVVERLLEEKYRK